MTAPKKKNPQDATLRNVRAEKTRDSKQDTKLHALEARIGALEAWVASQPPRSSEVPE